MGFTVYIMRCCARMLRHWAKIVSQYDARILKCGALMTTQKKQIPMALKHDVTMRTMRFDRI